MINTNDIRLYKSCTGISSWRDFIYNFYSSTSFSQKYSLLDRENYVVSLNSDGKAIVFDKKNGDSSGFWFTLDSKVVVII